jgi:hypothetical protein
MKAKLPDITPAQVIAVITWVVTQVVALGWVDNETGQWILQIAGTVIPSIWVLADMFIRGKRNEARAAIIASGGADPALTRSS